MHSGVIAWEFGRAGRRVAACLLVLIGAQLSVPQRASSQAPAERVRVPTSHANVHMGPSSTTEVLVLVPRGTVLTVLGRDNEWIQIGLTPDLRKSGMVMRWYKNEDRGWMHDSTVEVVKPAAPSGT
ncbi:MAG: SH3 domain-containing protein [Acidobacteria bacterium]|nr:SH3 domain-containing protein [Acidobacteriota bacterium]